MYGVTMPIFMPRMPRMPRPSAWIAQVAPQALAQQPVTCRVAHGQGVLAQLALERPQLLAPRVGGSVPAGGPLEDGGAQLVCRAAREGRHGMAHVGRLV